MGIYVGYSQKRRTVRIATAGKDQTIICPIPEVFLHATLTDESNLRNHTLYWEQISGSPVLLDNTDQLETGYSFVENTNKRFRFYLDYGTNKEQYKDVEVFHTPTSVTKNLQSRSSFSHVDQTIPQYVLTPDFIVPYDSYAHAPVAVTPVTRINYSAVSPELQEHLIGMYVLTNTIPNYYSHDPQTLWDSYLVGNIPLTFLLPEGVYKFFFLYDFAGNARNYSSPLIVSNHKASPQFPSTHVNDLIHVGNSYGKYVKDSIVRTEYPPKIRVDKNVEIFFIRVAESRGAYAGGFIRYTFVQTHVPEENVGNGSGRGINVSHSAGRLDTITRYDSSGIGA